MTVDFLPLLADGSNYPAPEFPMLPKARGKSRKTHRPLIANAKTSLWVSRARYGLAIIAQAALAPGSRILLPAYHCPALVEPFLWARCDVDFYPVNSDLTPKLATLTRKLESSDAIVFAPFFGFNSTAVGLADLARQQNCLPIEDLAHAAHARTLSGDYGVTSLEKFYPVSSGGELLVANSVSGTRVVDWWKGNHIHPRRWAIEEFFSKVRQKIDKGGAMNPTSDSHYRYFNPRHINAPMSQKDITQLARENHEKIAAVRRRNYRLLHEYFSHSRIGRPLFEHLGPEDVPYVYPFVLDKPDYFDLIRNMAIPLYRWEEISPSGCEVSSLYRSQLVQFPCHQDLADDDIKRIIAKLLMVERNLQISR